MDDKDIKTVLKFDTGADGFLKMIAVLAVGAVLVLIIGIYFLNTFFNDVRHLS